MVIQMKVRLGYVALSKALDDVTTSNLKVGKLITKEEIHPVFLRVDSELADKSKK